MLSKSTLKKVIFILLIILYSIQLSKAETYTVSPTGASDQKIINAAINAASPGDTVYLSSGIYWVDDTTILKSDIKLTGDPDAIIKVSSSSSQWFTGSTGIISCNEPVKNVEIYGFQIDGNLGSLPASYANTPGHDKDCERCIILHGDSGNYADNIKIHDMKLYDSFSDGAYIYYAKNVQFYNNLISNTQHEGVFFSVVIGGEIYNNRIAGITSDCARLDNCIECIVRDNIFFSYDGDNTNGAYKHGENGLQVGNAGSSHGYDASNKPTVTTNIEIKNNTFANNGLQAILMGSGSDNNVYIHDNKFIGVTELETMGISVKGITPTIEMSERIFSNIFDILGSKVTDSGRTDQKEEDITFQVQTTDQGKIAGGIKIIGFKDLIKIDNVSYIPDEKSIITKSAAMKSPSTNFLIFGTSNISKTVNTKIVNGKAYAELEVKMKYYIVKTDNKNIESTKKFKTSKATFNDSCNAPEILNRSTKVKASVNVYNDSKNPVTKLRVPYTNSTQKIEYTYGENTTTHTLMLGERLSDSNGLEYTAYTRCNLFEGNISHMGNELIIYDNFDPSKLHIKYYTPYESSEVTDIEIIYHKNEDEESQLMIILKFIFYLLFAMIAGYKIMEIAI
jgi:hypothetical protein